MFEPPTRPAKCAVARLAAAWAVVACAACEDPAPPVASTGIHDGPPVGVGTGGGTDDAGTRADAATDGDAGGQRCDALDLLFVVDDSVSMIEEQAALAAYAGSILDTLEGGAAAVDYQLGVAHTAFANPAIYGFVSPGLEGALLQTPDMRVPWLTASDTLRESELATMLSAGGEQVDADEHSQVALAAVGERAQAGGFNNGFVREGVALGIVIITDTDDQSLQSGDAAIDAVLETLDALEGSRGAWAISVIAGGRDPRCESDLGPADYAGALRALTDAAGSSGRFDSLCSGQLGPPLGSALGSVLSTCAQYDPATP